MENGRITSAREAIENAEKVDNAVKEIKVYCESREKCNGCRFDGGDRCEVQNIVSKAYKECDVYGLLQTTGVRHQ